MCPSCQRAGAATHIEPVVRPPDRFVANQLHAPRRWDLVVFRFGRDRSIRFVERVVGLPGEEVVIKEGGIWIDGVKQDPPAEIAKLTFSTSPFGAEARGSAERPIRLGDDEYFVVGDFSERSSDSRSWGALPGRYIEGVVALIYWPPERWRLFR